MSGILKHKVFLITLRLVLFFICLEGFLFLNRQWTVFMQNRQNVFFGDEETYRILCIGDSQTAYGGEDSYPQQLEEVLNARDLEMHFQVVNKGLPAATSSVILEQIQSWLQEYSPDMVITMMGMNDDLHEAESRRGGFKLGLLEKLGSVRLMRRTIENAWDAVVGRIHNSLQNDVKVEEQMIYGIYLQEMGEYAKARLIFSKLKDVQINNASFSGRVREEWMKGSWNMGDYKGVIETMTPILHQNPREGRSIFYLQEMCKQGIETERIRGLLQSLITEHDKSTTHMVLAGECYRHLKDTENADKIADRIRAIRQSARNPVLEANFRNLIEILRANRIEAVFAQYPLLPAEPLREILPADAVIVENATIFPGDVRERYDEYFVDYAFGESGHCTPKGNRLIAENLAAAVILLLNFSQTER